MDKKDKIENLLVIRNNLYNELSKYSKLFNWKNLQNKPAISRLIDINDKYNYPFKLLDLEIPIFEYYKNENDYLILTNSHLYYCNQDALIRINYQKIKHQKPLNPHELKLLIPFLKYELILKNDKKVIISIETGAPLHAFFLLNGSVCDIYNYFKTNAFEL